MGAWLAATRPKREASIARSARIPPPVLVLAAAIVGCVGGIGGGSILAPILIGAGRPPSEVAPAALATGPAWPATWPPRAWRWPR